MDDCTKCSHNHIKTQNKHRPKMSKKKILKKKCTGCHEIYDFKNHKNNDYCYDDCYSHKYSHNLSKNDPYDNHEYGINCKECNHNNYHLNKPRRRHRHNTTHDFTNTHGLISDHCFCHKYKLTGHFHSRKCCYQDLSVYYSGIIEDESTKKCVPNPKCKYYYSYS